MIDQEREFRNAEERQNLARGLVGKLVSRFSKLRQRGVAADATRYLSVLVELDMIVEREWFRHSSERAMVLGLAFELWGREMELQGRPMTIAGSGG